MRIKRILPLCFVSVLLSSCAIQVPPNGGPKDEKAPELLGSKPANKTTSFTADKIIIRTDEYIQIKDPSQILISPLINPKPTISTNGKNIEIEFLLGKPKLNTTYTINFGNSIADIHEGVQMPPFTYVFSTGNYLDSNQIKVKTLEAKTGLPLKK